MSSVAVRELRQENENGASPRQQIVSCCNLLSLRVIVKEGVNKSNHPIHNPLLLVTELQRRDILVSEVVTTINW
jgi:hypothetical protein